MTDKRDARTVLSPFVLLCILGGLAIFSTTMSKNPALPLFIRSLGVSKGTVGFIAAASTVVGVLVSLPAGILSDLYGRRGVMLASAFVFATAPFLYLLVRTPWQLVAVRIYHGLATAILGPVALAAVADTFEVRRGESMAWYSSATMVGRFLAPSIGGLLIAGSGGQAASFRWVYLGCGLTGILTLLLAIRLPLAQRQGAGGRAPRLQDSWRRLLDEAGYVVRHSGIRMISLVQAAQYFAFGFLEVYLPLRLADAGWKPAQIGPLFTVQVLSTTLSKPALGRLTDRFGRVAPIAGGLILGASGLVVIAVGNSYWFLMLGSALFGLGLAAVTTAAAALVTDLAHESSYGAAMGVLSSIMDVGQSTGPMLGGLAVAAFGYTAAFVGVAVLLMATAAVFPLVLRRH
jgi:DHA1 family multidrug resistance protein-like MFS transporter